MPGGGSIDPLFIPDNANRLYPDLTSIAGKTQVSPRLNGALKNIILVTIGQSNSVNIGPSAYTPSNSSIDQINLLNGGVYTAADPLVGCYYDVFYGPGNYALRLADKMRTAGWADRAIILPIAVPGTYVADWARGGAVNHRIRAASKRLLNLGYTPSAWIWQQGEIDNQFATSQAAYSASLASVIATIRDDWSTSVPIFITKSSYYNDTTAANVTNAQVAAVDHPNGIWLGADADSLTTAGGYRVDGTHWTNTGADQFATLTKNAMALYGAPFA